jgi:hypothetical protein
LRLIIKKNVSIYGLKISIKGIVERKRFRIWLKANVSL